MEILGAQDGHRATFLENFQLGFLQIFILLTNLVTPNATDFPNALVYIAWHFSM